MWKIPQNVTDCGIICFFVAPLYLDWEAASVSIFQGPYQLHILAPKPSGGWEIDWEGESFGLPPGRRIRSNREWCFIEFDLLISSMVIPGEWCFSGTRCARKPCALLHAFDPGTSCPCLRQTKVSNDYSGTCLQLKNYDWWLKSCQSVEIGSSIITVFAGI